MSISEFIANKKMLDLEWRFSSNDHKQKQSRNCQQLQRIIQ
ncbi:hypothetical protein pb186bvf_017654 [Paramecium bursaria]